MDIRSLNQAISQKQFSKLYFFYGEEDYLKEFYINRIIQAVVDDAFACFNLFHYREEPSREELHNALAQPPVMAEYKVVYLNQLELSTCDSALYLIFTCARIGLSILSTAIRLML